MTTTFQLYLQRHGQATHNAAEEFAALNCIKGESGIEDGPEFFDPALTVRGFSQAKDSEKPKGLSTDTDQTDEIEYWVSPLRRTLQTATAALPNVTKWRIVEAIREVGGNKLCDARHTKTEILQWLSEQSPNSVQEWNCDDIETETDELQEQEREGAYQVINRIYKALRLLLARSKTTGKTNFVWISHSGYISCLLAVLDCTKPNDRWLMNGEWRKIQVTEDQINQCLQSDTNKPLIISPLKLKKGLETSHLNALRPCQWPPSVTVKANQSSNTNQIFLFTTEMLSALTFATQPDESVKYLTLIAYPLLVKEHIVGAEEAASSASVLKVVKDKMAASFPQVEVLDGSHRITFRQKLDDIHVERLGVFTRSSVVVVCLPPKPVDDEGGDNKGGRQNGLPGFADLKYLEQVYQTAQTVQWRIAAPSIACVVPFDI